MKFEPHAHRTIAENENSRNTVGTTPALSSLHIHHLNIVSLSPPYVSPRLGLLSALKILINDTASRLGFLRRHSSDAMILQKYSRFVDGTIPVAALLYNDEENYASQDGVGIYDG